MNKTKVDLTDRNCLITEMSDTDWRVEGRNVRGSAVLYHCDSADAAAELAAEVCVGTVHWHLTSEVGRLLARDAKRKAGV